jgi:hypothetical protein
VPIAPILLAPAFLDGDAAFWKMLATLLRRRLWSEAEIVALPGRESRAAGLDHCLRLSPAVGACRLIFLAADNASR